MALKVEPKVLAEAYQNGIQLSLLPSSHLLHSSQVIFPLPIMQGPLPSLVIFIFLSFAPLSLSHQWSSNKTQSLLLIFHEASSA